MDKKCIICFCVHNLLKRECAYDLTKLKCCVCRTIIEIANEYRISNQFPSFLFYMNLNGVIIQFFHCCFEFTHFSIINFNKIHWWSGGDDQARSHWQLLILFQLFSIKFMQKFFLSFYVKDISLSDCQLCSVCALKRNHFRSNSLLKF